jgi:hypothetical protein
MSAVLCAKAERALHSLCDLPNVIARCLYSPQGRTLGLIISDVTNALELCVTSSCRAA